MSELIPLVLTACAGAGGALARWLLDQRLTEYWTHRTPLAGTAPGDTPRAPVVSRSAPNTTADKGWGWGIGLVNVTGCALAGILAALLTRYPGAWAILGTGFLGGYTTFSTAVLDVWTHLRGRRWGAALTLLLGVWFLGSGACLFGYWIGAHLL